jgi:hypothetical protein
MREEELQKAKEVIQDLQQQLRYVNGHSVAAAVRVAVPVPAEISLSYLAFKLDISNMLSG